LIAVLITFLRTAAQSLLVYGQIAQTVIVNSASSVKVSVGLNSRPN
jgi:hypothetical protein